MAEAIGVVSGLITLVGFAYQSSTTLHNLIKSFKSHVERVRELAEELDALIEVLKSLQITVHSDCGTDLSVLELPLSRCGKACDDFAAIIVKCSSRSKNDRTSFRDWVKIKYMGEDIDGFRRLLSSYKQVIGLALTNANLHKSSATADGIQKLSEQLKATQANLEDRFCSITAKLDSFGGSIPTAESEIADIDAICEERRSTEKCLQICADLSEHIAAIQLEPKQSTPAASSSAGGPQSVRLTSSTLRECKESISRTTRKLQAHHKSLLDESFSKLKAQGMTSQQLNELGQLQEELEAILQSKEMCSTIKNTGTGDLFQVMASTDGTIINGVNEGHGRAVQGGGHFDPGSFQTLMQTMQSRGATMENLEVSVSETGSSVILGKKHDQATGTSFTGPGVRLSGSGSNLSGLDARRVQLGASRNS